VQKKEFLYSKPLQEGQNLHLTFQAIPGMPKPTSASLRRSSQAKTDLLHSKPSGQVKIDFLPSKPFQSNQNQLPPFQAIPINIVNKFFLLSLPCRS
jgi:hypothetical protein